jgi:FHS family glucose/mannose:H+ symporter-like MFS transporter
MSRLIYLACITFLIVGLGQLVVGTVMEPMVHAYGIQYEDGGQLVMNQFLGMLAGTLVAPMLIRRFGKKVLLLTAIGLMAVSEIVYAMQPPWWAMLTAAPIAGFGFGTSETLVSSFIIGAAGDRANVVMSRVEVSFGLGALLIPFAGAYLIASGHWRVAFALVGVMSAAVLLLWIVRWPSVLDRGASIEGGAVSNEVAASQEVSPVRRRWMMLALFVPFMIYFVIYVGFEMSFVHYLPSLLVELHGLPDSTASLSLSLFWGAMVIGRLVAGHAADRFGGPASMLTMCSAAAVLFVLLGLFQGVTATYVLTFAAGLAMSGMFAVALVFANRSIGGKTEQISSVLIACGGLGGALMPKLAGWFLDHNGASATMWLFTSFAAVMLIVIVWAIVAAKQRKTALEG